MESSGFIFEFPITAKWLSHKLPQYYEVQYKNTKDNTIAPSRSRF